MLRIRASGPSENAFAKPYARSSAPQADAQPLAEQGVSAVLGRLRTTPAMPPRATKGVFYQALGVLERNLILERFTHPRMCQ